MDRKNKSNHHQKNGSSNKPHNNPFRNNKKMNDFKKSNNKFKKFRENVNLIQHDATPWSELKKPNIPISNPEVDNEKIIPHQNLNIDEINRQKALKKRNESHRKFVIEEKQKEKPKWENFDEDNDDNGDNEKKNNPSTSKYNNNKKNKNFNTDVTTMDFKTANYYRRAITKLTCLSKGSTLENAINDLKRVGVGKKRKF